jgi:hypothetical protein
MPETTTTGEMDVNISTTEVLCLMGREPTGA